MTERILTPDYRALLDELVACGEEMVSGEDDISAMLDFGAALDAARAALAHRSETVPTGRYECIVNGVPDKNYGSSFTAWHAEAVKKWGALAYREIEIAWEAWKESHFDALSSVPSATQPLLDEAGKFFDWGNAASVAMKNLLDAYERRIRSECTPEQIEKKPWECAEFIVAKQILDAKPNWFVAVSDGGADNG